MSDALSIFTAMKTNKIIYWTVTFLFGAWMAFQGVMFVIASDQFTELFASLGMPSGLIIPLGIAKILGVIAIISNIHPLIKRLAYLGFIIDFLIAIGAHVNAGDGNWIGAVIALILCVLSYSYWRKIY